MADLKKSGIVFDIQSLSFHDGPGIRTLIFLKGCPLTCKWCANPEGQSSNKELRYYSINCSGCLNCKKKCVNNAISKSDSGERFINIDRDKCSTCSDFTCIEACTNEALKSIGEVMTVGMVMNKIKRDCHYYKGDGGVTLSGGDPTYQPEFAVEILKACQEEYISTAVESAMFTSLEVADEFLPYTDMFLIDIKHMDSCKHKEFTGVPNEQILKNISEIAKRKRVVIRIPVIPGFNDDDANIIATINYSLHNQISQIHILPYHKLGIGKYEQLGMDYQFEEVEPRDANRIQHLKQLIESYGIECLN